VTVHASDQRVTGWQLVTALDAERITLAKPDITDSPTNSTALDGSNDHVNVRLPRKRATHGTSNVDQSVDRARRSALSH
jgi:hypothetical protein